MLGYGGRAPRRTATARPRAPSSSMSCSWRISSPRSPYSMPFSDAAVSSPPALDCRDRSLPAGPPRARSAHRGSRGSWERNGHCLGADRPASERTRSQLARNAGYRVVATSSARNLRLPPLPRGRCRRRPFVAQCRLRAFDFAAVRRQPARGHHRDRARDLLPPNRRRRRASRRARAGVVSSQPGNVTRMRGPSIPPPWRPRLRDLGRNPQRQRGSVPRSTRTSCRAPWPREATARHRRPCGGR